MDNPTVLGFVGSPRRGGNTHILVDEILRGAGEAGGTVQKIDLARLDIAPCDACDTCRRTGKCIHEDDFPPLYEQMKTSDVWVFGTPIYWWGPTAQFKVFLDRWYAPVEEFKAMPDKHIILALALESKKEKTARHTVGILTESAQWINKTVNDVVIATDVKYRGDIKKYSDILERAYQVGRSAVLG